MFPIEQSAFLQALGRSIGNSLWQVAGLWLLYAAITGLFKLKSAQKYQLAVLASITGFVLFISTFIYTLFFVPLPASSSLYTFSDTVENPDRSSTINSLLYFYHSCLATLRSLLPYISCAYLLVFAILGLRLVNGFRQVTFFASQGLDKADIQIRLFVKRNAELLQIKKSVKVFTSKYVQSPLTMGFWKPIILLPVASLNHLNTHQIEAILLHELAHIKRHDYLINIFVQIAEIGLFFNPFMRLLIKQIKLERENSCDDYVLQFQYNATDYAKALLALEKNNSASLLALSARNNQSFQLLNRIKRMVAPQPHAFNYRQQLGLLLLITILGLGFTVIVPKPKLKNPVAAQASFSGTSNTLSEEKITTLPEEKPILNDAFDLIKSLQGLGDGMEGLDLAEIEKRGKQIEEKANVIGNEIGQKVERKMQPFISEITNWASHLSDEPGNIAKIEASSKDLENKLKLVETRFQGENLEIELRPAMKKLEELFKSFPFKKGTGFKFPPMPSKLTVAIPRVLASNQEEYDERLADEKRMQSDIERKQSRVEEAMNALQMKKAQLEMENSILEEKKMEANADLDIQMKSLANKIKKEIIARKYCKTAPRDATKDEEMIVEETAAPDEEAETEDIKPVNPHFNFSMDFPDLAALKNLNINAVIQKHSQRNSNSKTVRNYVLSGTNNKAVIEAAMQGAEDADEIEIKQEKHAINGKEEKVVVIKISSSK